MLSVVEKDQPIYRANMIYNDPDDIRYSLPFVGLRLSTADGRNFCWDSSAGNSFISYSYWGLLGALNGTSRKIHYQSLDAKHFPIKFAEVHEFTDWGMKMYLALGIDGSHPGEAKARKEWLEVLSTPMVIKASPESEKFDGPFYFNATQEGLTEAFFAINALPIEEDFTEGLRLLSGFKKHRNYRDTFGGSIGYSLSLVPIEKMQDLGHFEEVVLKPRQMQARLEVRKNGQRISFLCTNEGMLSAIQSLGVSHWTSRLMREMKQCIKARFSCVLFERGDSQLSISVP